jgi:hypothetical protein
MDESAEMRQQSADALNEHDLLALAIAEAACKLGISSEGVALTGPHLLMLLGDMVGMVEGLQARNVLLARYIVKADAFLDELGCPLDELIDLFEVQSPAAAVSGPLNFVNRGKAHQVGASS